MSGSPVDNALDYLEDGPDKDVIAGHVWLVRNELVRLRARVAHLERGLDVIQRLPPDSPSGNASLIAQAFLATAGRLDTITLPEAPLDH